LDKPSKAMMLINSVRGEECRIAVVQAGRLEELFSERASTESHVGNIYKGRVTNVEPSIQAAFIDFGFEKNGFLHVSDLHPQHFPSTSSGQVRERVGKKTPRRDRPSIQKCLKRGQEIVVQVIKEGIGSKGPTLTTYLSIPGRYLVMMPGMNRLGVSRKIEDDAVRQKLRRTVADLKPPQNIGFIIRTAGIDRTKREIQRDLNYLKRLWKVVDARIKTSKAPAELYQESDLVTRTIRDVFSSQIDKILVDDQDVARKTRDFLGIVMPRYQNRASFYEGKVPLFHKYGVEEQIAQITSRRVELASGGSLVIDQTEALVAIDVNSGKFRESADPERMALDINLETVPEIVRHLRLRDLGGVVVIDFIDMRYERNRRTVERKLRDELRKDRAKTKVLRMSAFGIIELTRQRMRTSHERSISDECPMCAGTGHIKSVESVGLDIMRLLQLAMYNQQVDYVQVNAPGVVCEYLQNRRRRALVQLEDGTNKRLELFIGRDFNPDEYSIHCFDERQQEIDLADITEAARKTSERQGRRRRSKKPASVHAERADLAEDVRAEIEEI